MHHAAAFAIAVANDQVAALRMCIEHEGEIFAAHQRPGTVVRAGGAERLVWGFTAMLLDGLFTRVGWTESWDQARELPLDGWV